MNIFYLSPNPSVAAEQHCDKHVVKMVVEYAQLLSTAHRVLDGDPVLSKSKSNRSVKRYILPDDRNDTLYLATHPGHPDGVWVRQSSANYYWLYDLFVALSKEYTHRYGKVHATYAKLKDALAKAPSNIPDGKFTEPPQAMDDECKDESVVQAYRNYYNTSKKHFLSWKNRPVPDWVCA